MRNLRCWVLASVTASASSFQSYLDSINREQQQGKGNPPPEPVALPPVDDAATTPSSGNNWAAATAANPQAVNGFIGKAFGENDATMRTTPQKNGYSSQEEAKPKDPYQEYMDQWQQKQLQLQQQQALAASAAATNKNSPPPPQANVAPSTNGFSGSTTTAAAPTKRDPYQEYMDQMQQKQQQQRQQQPNAPVNGNSFANGASGVADSKRKDPYLEYMQKQEVEKVVAKAQSVLEQQQQAVPPLQNGAAAAAAFTPQSTAVAGADYSAVLPFNARMEQEGILTATKKKSNNPFVNLLANNPFDTVIDKQLDLGKVQMDDVLQDYNALLKKHMRLALTGGVPLNREMMGERYAPALDTTGMTERILKQLPGGAKWEAFQSAEANWARLREYIPSSSMSNEMNPYYNDDGVPSSLSFVTEHGGEGNPKCYAKLHHQKARSLDFDVCVCGGTFGVFYAAALQLAGHRVCLVETPQTPHYNSASDKEEEWNNLSLDDLERLKTLKVVTQEDIDAAVTTEFLGCRLGFKNKEVPIKGDGYLDNGVGYECFAKGVSNLGISPAILVQRVSQRFVSLGGVIRRQDDPRSSSQAAESPPLQGVCIMREIGASLDFGPNEEPITAHLVVDAMGAQSPITLQSRYGKKPDGICAVVGTTADGFDPTTNLIGDLIYTNTAVQDKGREGGRMQYFWQSFPVGIGENQGQAPGTSGTKTTCMFTYMDAHQRRPTLETLFSDYWRLLPQYQPSIQNPETDLQVQRVHFAFVPTYKDSPLPPKFNRVLAVGEALGVQTPLLGSCSTGAGFASMTRHLSRVTTAITEALELNLLSKEDLAEIHPYTPNLAASWMLQKSMSVRIRQPFVDKRFVNRLLATNLEIMDQSGRGSGQSKDQQAMMKPFLQDVIRFDTLASTVVQTLLHDPTLVPQIVAWVGLPTLISWMGHLGCLGTYAALDNYVAPWLGPVGQAALKKDESRFRWNRQLDAWKYGSGNDYGPSKKKRNNQP